MQEHIRVKKSTTKLPNRESRITAKGKNSSHPLLKIQQSVGNKATIQLCGSLERLQTKLSIGQPDDIYEQEADTVAQRVVNQISKTGGSISNINQEQPQSIQMLQRQAEEEEEQEEEESVIQTRLSDHIQRQDEAELQERLTNHIQRQEDEELFEKGSSQDQSGSDKAGEINGALENQVQRERQGGEALDASTRSQMESGFGYDFGGVNIHTDSVADHISRQLNAEAFTIKDNIFFRNGRYNPASTQGQDLLAHELTHVVQQGAASSRDASSVESF